MTKATLWHNPRCSKSRQTLALLEENGISPKIRKYLEDPPSENEIREALSMLGVEPRALMRRKEALYKELHLDRQELSHDDLIQAMHENPRLIERPLFFHKKRAALGRPPENVLALLS